jgi:hypothetical protein
VPALGAERCPKLDRAFGQGSNTDPVIDCIRLRIRLILWLGASLGGLAGCFLGATTTTPSRPHEVAGHVPAAPFALAPAATPPKTEAPRRPRRELPRGGWALFPTFRLAGYCGTPGAPALGELQGNLAVKVKALEASAAKLAGTRAVLPVLELIAVVVQAGPGPDGKYRRRVDSVVVDEYLRAARSSHALLLLNIQPGRSDFLTEVKAFEAYLREPEVGVALDPEWAIKPGEKPGVNYGQTSGEEIRAVAEYLAAIVAEADLPEKALVYHEVNRYVVKDEAAIQSAPGVVVIKSVDGLGPVGAKIATYVNLMEVMPKDVRPGFKLFFDEDTRNGSRLMTPREVLALVPAPDYVMFE